MNFAKLNPAFHTPAPTFSTVIALRKKMMSSSVRSSRKLVTRSLSTPSTIGAACRWRIILAHNEATGLIVFAKRWLTGAFFKEPKLPRSLGTKSVISAVGALSYMALSIFKIFSPFGTRGLRMPKGCPICSSLTSQTELPITCGLSMKIAKPKSRQCLINAGETGPVTSTASTPPLLGKGKPNRSKSSVIPTSKRETMLPSPVSSDLISLSTCRASRK
mmetsp:Transcript_70112/g.150132  ORF Transcript_70112/g.150132 Transcript_70112/m.150132 type:complete len:218 (-) Transcript_70112:58-711(-)